MREAMYYVAEGDRVRCGICPHRCLVPEGGAGLCRTRRNRGGRLFTLIYGLASSMHLDPIEKKPLYHFHPGAKILSFGTLGCNFSCLFCQNWSISQAAEADMDRIENNPPADPLTPSGAADAAVQLAGRGNIGIAWTYNEPSIWYEFVLDTARIVKEMGLVNCMVTNGYIEEEPLAEILPFIDAFNVDIKSIRDEFYVKYCRGHLAPVLRTCALAAKSALVEVTNLVIPTLNDSRDDFEKLTDWIYEHMGADTPLHFSRYHPDYRAEFPATPPATLEMAGEIAAKKLHYVYVGNVHTAKWDSTRCPKCGKVVVGRQGFSLTSVALTKDNRCKACSEPIRIVGTVRA